MLMRVLTTVAALVAFSVCGASADGGLLVPIEQFIHSANVRDRAQLIAAFSGDATIVDEFAPFRFGAPNAAAHWFDGLSADQQFNGITDVVFAVRPPSYLTVRGDRAYVVVPAVYSCRIAGRPVTDVGSLAFTLVRGGYGWKIDTMAWTRLPRRGRRWRHG